MTDSTTLERAREWLRQNGYMYANIGKLLADFAASEVRRREEEIVARLEECATGWEQGRAP